MSNTLGNKLRVTVFGQSHAPAIGAVIARYMIISP